ncbi:hypothetical protein [uncultured Sphaerochaeta sp.]|uniref:hypothetical protein n=1 Tax=uncultured Sphaerochaeta sp. TaxID=886478 RepID=UPI002A0A0EB9|nr:hypothetical protein [uncultured Sphaerochaeta sp.]
MEKQYIVLKLNNMGYRTRELETGNIVSLKSDIDFETFELETITVEVEKEWIFKKNSYVSGKLLKHELILANLDVPPLEYENIERNRYVFKDYSGYGFYTPGRDPISEALRMDPKRGYDALARLWEHYPQCIDALVQMGMMNFNSTERFKGAFNCFSGATYIAEQNFPVDETAQFPWFFSNNRPYLRALLALSCWYWKNGDFDEAALLARKILRINLKDDQGARHILEAVRNKEVFRPDF